MLRECLVMGVDDVILLSDRVFGGVDIWVILNIIVVGIFKVGDYDIIFVGR